MQISALSVFRCIFIYFVLIFVLQSLCIEKGYKKLSIKYVIFTNFLHCMDPNHVKRCRRKKKSSHHCAINLYTIIYHGWMELNSYVCFYTCFEKVPGRHHVRKDDSITTIKYIRCWYRVYWMLLNVVTELFHSQILRGYYRCEVEDFVIIIFLTVKFKHIKIFLFRANPYYSF